MNILIIIFIISALPGLEPGISRPKRDALPTWPQGNIFTYDNWLTGKDSNFQSQGVTIPRNAIIPPVNVLLSIV